MGERVIAGSRWAVWVPGQKDPEDILRVPQPRPMPLGVGKGPWGLRPALLLFAGDSCRWSSLSSQNNPPGRKELPLSSNGSITPAACSLLLSHPLFPQTVHTHLLSPYPFSSSLPDFQSFSSCPILLPRDPRYSVDFRCAGAWWWDAQPGSQDLARSSSPVPGHSELWVLVLTFPHLGFIFCRKVQGSFKEETCEAPVLCLEPKESICLGKGKDLF